MILEGTLKLSSESTWELTWEPTWEPTWELAWKAAVGASADVWSVVGAFAADEPFLTGSAQLWRLWYGEICAVGCEEPSPLCSVPIAVVAFADAAIDVGRLDVAATCVGAASVEVAFAEDASAEETFAVDSSEPLYCAVRGVQVVVLV